MICSNQECGEEFEPKTHNQIYCSDVCCRIVTNKKMMERYYAKRARKLGIDKTCITCRKDVISRYSEDVECSLCKMKKDSERNSIVKNRLANVIWN